MAIAATLTYFMYNDTDPSTDAGDCETGDVRFSNSSDNSDEGSRQGTLQICINNAWGAVCSDNLFDNTDAGVFCDLLEGFTSDSKNNYTKF